jgi:membrane protease YdiL (CAAX protease family)
MQLRQLLRDGERETRVLLLTAGVLLVLTMNHASREFAAGVLDRAPDDPAVVLWHYAGTFVLLGIAPLLSWRLHVRGAIADIGLCAGDARFATRFSAVMLPLLVLAAWISSHDPAIREEYPLAAVGAGDARTLLGMEAAYLLYYTGWEIFFRGYLVLGLAPRIGAFPAVALSTLVSTAAHYGKPEGEVWAALVAGILLGWYVLRTRSILGAIVFHAAVGIATDLFVTYAPGTAG